MVGCNVFPSNLKWLSQQEKADIRYHTDVLVTK